MIPAARLQSAIELATQLEQNAIPADRLAHAYYRRRRYIGASDRRAISEHLYNMLRNRARLDWWVARTLVGLPSASLPAVGRGRMLAAQMLIDKIDPTRLRIMSQEERHGLEALSQTEWLLIERLSGQNLDHPEQPDWVRYEIPNWLFEILQTDLSTSDMAPETEYQALLQTAPLDLRVNTFKGNRQTVQAQLADEGIISHPTLYSPFGLRVDPTLSKTTHVAGGPVFQQGLVEVQDEGAQMIALMTDVRPGHRVVDFCAGAGGKTLALAAMMQGRGYLLACDISAERLDRAKIRIKRAGLQNIQRHLLTGTYDRWIKRHKYSFDRVLIDAPCSGVGTWRRNPDARWSLTPQALATRTKTQAELLASASRLVRPGGRLVYATCSLLSVENDAQLERFLESMAGQAFRLIAPLTLWQQLSQAPPPCTEHDKSLTLTPARHDMDGFYCAVLERLS